MFSNYTRKAYRKALLAVLGVTRGFYRMNFNIPSRWQGLFNALQAFSGLVYSTLSTIDAEAEREVLEWETRFERSLGREKFYSEDDVERISEEFSKIQL